MLTPYIEIGEVLRPHGIQGLVKVRPETDDPQRFLALKSVWLAQGKDYRPAEVREASVREDGFVYLRLDGAESRNDAEKQRGLLLYVDRANARELGRDEWFICDLIGCRVIGDRGTEIGTMRDVLLGGPNPVMVIGTAKGNLLVAMMKFVLGKVDPEAGLVVLCEDRLPEVAVYE